MRIQSFATVSLLSMICSVAKTEAPKCTENSAVPFVQYCDLVREPGKHDGHLLRTEAVWQKMVHSGALADRSCPASGPDLLLTLPSFSQDSNFKSAIRKELWKLLDKGGTARVRIMGIFHGAKGRPYASDGQRFQMEIKCLLTVTPLKPGDKGN